MKVIKTWVVYPIGNVNNQDASPFLVIFAMESLSC